MNIRQHVAQPIMLGIKRCHHPNLDSVLISNEPFIKRAFIANGDSGDITVAPHSHRSSLKITVLEGYIEHYTFETIDQDVNRFLESYKLRYPWQPCIELIDSGDLYKYKSVLLGGEGLSSDFERVKFSKYKQDMYAGDKAILDYKTIHTVKWNKGAVWLIEEGPVLTEETSVFLRAIDNFNTHGLYQEMSNSEYLEKLDMVMRKIWLM